MLYKINSKWIKELNMRANILKTLGDKKKKYINLYDFGISSSFLGTTSKARSIHIKIDILDFIKIKNVFASKNITQKVKRNLPN